MLNYKQTDNDLRETALANHNGFDKIKSTETSLVNYGLELQVGGRPLSSQSDWNLYCNFTLAFNKVSLLNCQMICARLLHPIIHTSTNWDLIHLETIYMYIKECMRPMRMFRSILLLVNVCG